MLRTSLRRARPRMEVSQEQFLSSNAQDFIEDIRHQQSKPTTRKFLSSNAQDFIEDARKAAHWDNQSVIPEQ